MSAPESREALEIVRRLEAALLAVERDVTALDTESSPPLSPEEHRRLTRHLEALLGEVREFADFLATGDSDRDPSDPR